MITEILLFLCALVILCRIYYYTTYRPEGFPPGPPRLPLFGSYLFMMLSNFHYMHKAVLNFSKWYKSDIVGFYMGSFPVVAVHNPDVAREVLFNSEFDGRPQVYLAQMRTPSVKIAGIFFQEGPIWREQRRFILRYLRDFGFGRRFNELELVIKEEITDFLNLIRNGPKYAHEEEICAKGGYRIQLPYAFNPWSANSLFHIMFNERFQRAEQAPLIKLLRMGMQFQRAGDDYGKMLSILPWVRHFFPNWSSYNKIMEANVFIYGFFENFIDRYVNTYDPSAERNFIDLYVSEMKRQEELKENGTEAAAAAAEETTFSREQFIMSLIDFSFPAFTAVGVQISLLMQYFLLYPDVLKRVQSEIDEVVGSGRLPNLEDRKNLHFTEATIREGLRIETLVPSDVPHKAVVDTELMGYKIPKDTIVVPSLYAYHADERLWGDPLNFRPERFLDETGKLCLKKDVSFPFGAGKRLCAGETFARNMLFLMTTAICQNFNLVLGPNDTMPDLTRTLSGFIISPPDFWLQLEERK